MNAKSHSLWTIFNNGSFLQLGGLVVFLFGLMALPAAAQAPEQEKPMPEQQSTTRPGTFTISGSIYSTSWSQESAVFLAEDFSDLRANQRIGQITTSNLDLGRAIGGRLRLETALREGRSMHLDIALPLSWEGQASLENFVQPFSAGLFGVSSGENFESVDRIEATQQRSYFDAGFGYTLVPTGGPLTATAQLRYIRLQDELELLATGMGIDTGNPATDRNGTEVINNMFGLQLEARYEYRRKWFELQLTGRGGLFANRVDLEMLETTDANPGGNLSGTVIELSGQKMTPALTWDGGIRLSVVPSNRAKIGLQYQLSTVNRIATAAQQLALLGGQASFPSQISDTDSNVNTKGLLNLHQIGLIAELNF